MELFRAHCRMYLIAFGIPIIGLIFCVTIVVVLLNFFGTDSVFVKVSFCVLIIPALICFMLGIGLGANETNKVWELSAERKLTKFVVKYKGGFPTARDYSKVESAFKVFCDRQIFMKVDSDGVYKSIGQNIRSIRVVPPDQSVRGGIDWV